MKRLPILRPPLTSSIRIRCSPAERDQWHRAAARERMTLSQWVRWLLHKEKR
jgi:hypothetical protein